MGHAGLTLPQFFHLSLSNVEVIGMPVDVYVCVFLHVQVHEWRPDINF